MNDTKSVLKSLAAALFSEAGGAELGSGYPGFIASRARYVADACS